MSKTLPKRILGIVIVIALISALGWMVHFELTHDHDTHSYDHSCSNHYHTDCDASYLHHITHSHSHSLLSRSFHLVIHIIICLVGCIVLHRPAHKFYDWIKGLLGISRKKNCHRCDYH